MLISCPECWKEISDKAGTNRVVPIHEKIKGMVESAYDVNEEKLFPGWNFNKYIIAQISKAGVAYLERRLI